MADEPRLVAGRYLLHEELSQGGMGSVWRARDQVLARSVAVKVLHEHLAHDPGFLERFRREAFAAARLSHPNIVSIYDTGEEEFDGGTSHFIVMEYCPGGTLEDILRSDAPLPPTRIASIGVAIAGALEHAHAEGVIHRDVKPANVLIGPDGSLKVADFGIAKAVETEGDVTTTGKILGTVAYVSPEHATGADLDARSDVYGLGVVLYELAVGEPPFKRDSHLATAMAHVNDLPAPIRSRRAGFPRDLESLVLKALAKDPKDRFQNAGEMRRALERLATREGAGATATIAAARAPSASEAPTTLRSETRWVIPVLAVVALTAALGFGLNALFQENRSNDNRTPGSTNGGSAIEIQQATDFDPEGDGAEHPGDVAQAYDGDASTYWTTESYEAAFFEQKEGVGLIFDLGDTMAVSQVTLDSLESDFDVEIRVADELGDSIDDFTEVAAEEDLTAPIDIAVDAEGRYWLVLITALPGDAGGRVTLTEVGFSGS